jgi:hypothetical protein
VAYRSIESWCTVLQGKSKAKGTFEHRKHSYRKFTQNTRSMQKRNRGAQVENSSIAWRQHMHIQFPYCAPSFHCRCRPPTTAPCLRPLSHRRCRTPPTTGSRWLPRGCRRRPVWHACTRCCAPISWSPCPTCSDMAHREEHSWCVCLHVCARRVVLCDVLHDW